MAQQKRRKTLFTLLRSGLQCISCTPYRRSTSSRRMESSSGKTDPNPREYFDMTASVSKFSDAEFEQVLKRSLQYFNDLAYGYLEKLLLALNVDIDYVKNIAALRSDSLTTLRLLKYYYHGDVDKETCIKHTDRGLITLAYCQKGGLTVKDFHTHQWIDIEASAPKKPCLVLFTGESLSRLTGGYFRPILHKVVSKEDRYSFPFFLRGRSPALLDMTLLRSQPLHDLLSFDKVELLPPITVEQLDSITTKQYKDNSLSSDLGREKKDPYYVFADEVEVV